MEQQKIFQFERKVLEHYKKNKRTFPWRTTHNPYYILVSEIMLQQTQTIRVIDKYLAFLKKFPTIQTLAEASTQEVLVAWQGLGYNRRALLLKKTAQEVVEAYEGVLPRTPETLEMLPGIGPYTARAVCAFAYGISSAFVETNIRTAIIHQFFADKTGIHDTEIMMIVGELVKGKDVREWYYALMDYGSMIKKTHGNLSKKSKHYTTQSKFEGSFRQKRSAFLRIILGRNNGITVKACMEEMNLDRKITKEVLDSLIKDGMILEKSNRFFIVH